MREIKFRAWNKESNKWLNTDWFGVSADGWLLNENGRDTLIRSLPEVNDKYILMQYTGLQDKNGVDIYEGDMVRYEATKGRFGIHQIIYEPRAAAFLLQAITRASNNPVGMKYLGDIARSNNSYDTRTYELCEVIGNIHENPELLK